MISVETSRANVGFFPYLSGSQSCINSSALPCLLYSTFWAEGGLSSSFGRD